MAPAPRDPNDLMSVVERALAEDAPAGDLTGSSIVPASESCRAELRIKAPGVLAGTRVAQVVFDVVSKQDGLGSVDVEWKASDGQRVESGDLVALLHGPARSILRAERVALNFLTHLSGIATLTRAFVDAATPARVLCTRKTTPCLRAIEREAVSAGGGDLHRASLSDAVLIKDNHLRVAGGAGEAVRRARAALLPGEIEVEAETLEELEDALVAGADRILLDNPGPDLVRQAVARVGDPDRLEVSGGITLDSIQSLVEAGARVISVGRITHSAPSLDISLEVLGAG
jgi:nicotinate-nucleotide pyrophosphorylase (carboxylating)